MSSIAFGCDCLHDSSVPAAAGRSHRPGRTPRGTFRGPNVPAAPLKRPANVRACWPHDRHRERAAADRDAPHRHHRRGPRPVLRRRPQDRPSGGSPTAGSPTAATGGPPPAASAPTRTWLWPDAARPAPGEASQSELVRLYPDRGSIPRGTWRQLLEGAREEIGVLVYAALFLAEDPAARRLLADRPGRRPGAAAARRPRRRGGRAAAARRRASGRRDRREDPQRPGPVPRPSIEAGAEIRLHDTDALQLDLPRPTTSCSSTPTSRVHRRLRPGPAPAPDLRRRLVAAYLESFERVWDGAKPWNGG